MGKDRHITKYRKTQKSGFVLTMFKNKAARQEQCRTDYRDYIFCGKERIRMMAEYVFLSGAFAYLFYRSWMIMALFWILYPVYRRRRKKQMIQTRQDILCMQFKDSIQCVASSMTAGYSIENAFREAYAEIRIQYGEHALMTEELRYIKSCLSLNVPLEQLLYDFANRSGLEDVRSFCEVFVFAKRSGGDFIQIIRLTTTRISEKNELMNAIRTEISGKKMEQKIMNLMPLFILLYVDVSFGGYLDGMYHNVFGILVMTVCLALYLAGYLLSEKITQIRV